MSRIVFGVILLVYASFITGIIGSPLEREELTTDSIDTSNTAEITKTETDDTDHIENATKINNNKNNNENKNEEQEEGIIADNQNNIKSESSSSVATTEINSGVNSSSNSSIKSSDHPTSSVSKDTTTTDSPKNGKNETLENDVIIISENNDTLLGGHDPEATKKYIDSKLRFWKDDFILSIITPVGIGLGCALVILGVIACCRCSTKKLCMKRRMSKSRIRTDVRKMKHKDRVKLLAASSDDEF